MKPILVVKVGTSTLLPKDNAPSDAFDTIAKSVMVLSKDYQVILVTSGAIGFGVTQLGIAARPNEIAELQALSMIGQVGILRRWREAFDNVTIGQVLVTRKDLENTGATAAFCQSINAVWGYDAVPIVNENDAVSSEEISFGDNDRLAAEVAAVLRAEILVLLTDQDGIQADFGTINQHRLEQVLISEVDQHITSAKSAHGKGGALSKVQAAQVALAAGVAVYVGYAVGDKAVERVLSGQVGTKLVQ